MIPTTTPEEAEELLLFAISTCVNQLEIANGVSMPVFLETEHAGDDVWHIAAWSETLNVDFGTWAVLPLIQDAKHINDAANKTQGVLASSSGVCTVNRLASR